MTLRFSLAAVAALGLTASLASAAERARAQTSAVADRSAQVVQLAVTKEGFVPKQVVVKAGRPVKLVVTRKVERTCATEIVMKDFGVKVPLPLDRPVTVEVTPKKPGDYRFACGMDMIAGVLKAE